MGATCRVSCPVVLWGVDGQRWVFSHTNHFGSSHKALDVCFWNIFKSPTSRGSRPPTSHAMASPKKKFYSSVSLKRSNLAVALNLNCCVFQYLKKYIPQITALNGTFLFSRIKKKNKKDSLFKYIFQRITKLVTNYKCQRRTERIS